jgi:nucleotide-binding universal stress UspA family protein
VNLPRKILVPTDFSPRSDFAVDYAIGLAKKLGAEIILVHACEIPPLGFVDAAALVTITSRILGGAQAALEGLVAKHSGVPVRGVLKDTSAWDAIMMCIKEEHIDLVVMGTHGRRGLPRAILGSVAEKVIRTAPCPVLTVHGEETQETSPDTHARL